MSGPSKDERGELTTAFQKTNASKNEVGAEKSRTKTWAAQERRDWCHQAENTLLASVRDAKGISGSKVECLRLCLVGYTIFQGSWRVSELSVPRRRCLSRSYNVTKEVSMPYPKSQIQIRYAHERGREHRER